MCGWGNDWDWHKVWCSYNRILASGMNGIKWFVCFMSSATFSKCVYIVIQFHYCGTVVGLMYICINCKDLITLHLWNMIISLEFHHLKHSVSSPPISHVNALCYDNVKKNNLSIVHHDTMILRTIYAFFFFSLNSQYSNKSNSCNFNFDLRLCKSFLLMHIDIIHT